MNETVKNSFKGFKVKGILIVLAALLVCILAACAFNNGSPFYVVAGVIAILSAIAYVIKAILDNKAQTEAQFTAEAKERYVQKQLEAAALAKSNFESEISKLKTELAKATARYTAAEDQLAAVMSVDMEAKPQAAPAAKKANTNKKK